MKIQGGISQFVLTVAAAAEFVGLARDVTNTEGKTVTPHFPEALCVPPQSPLDHTPASSA